jgi:hypothetical protein
MVEIVLVLTLSLKILRLKYTGKSDKLPNKLCHPIMLMKIKDIQTFKVLQQYIKQAFMRVCEGK